MFKMLSSHIALYPLQRHPARPPTTELSSQK